MVDKKSLDPYRQIVVALLRDVQTLHSEVFTPKSLRLTTAKVNKRCDEEGIGFLTKTLPRLAKALDRALTGELSIDAAKLGFKSLPNSKLPRFLGELFGRVFSHDGWILPTPCVDSIKTLRNVLLVFYKLEIPYDTDQEQQVLSKFIRTEKELEGWNKRFEDILKLVEADASVCLGPSKGTERYGRIIRTARRLLAKLFGSFNVYDIHPKHGPGAVSTRETLSGKYVWTKVSSRITQTYPLDAFFYASLGHICDDLARNNCVQEGESSARVLLVPKDSRGPRLISCEPLDFQWIQQGLGRAIVQHVEEHPLTRYSVHFTDQRPNQCGAQLGSKYGRYATLDLNEASDRVSVGLVRLLFPEPLLGALMNCRSQSTVLPGGEELTLNKFAPMGSALCFPILALTIWALLAAGLPDAVSGGTCLRKRCNTFAGSAPCSDCVRDQILVYGDDVVVPTANAADAINILESFGLLCNRDKSCTSGFFRESCGMDAYKGVSVTPVRFRTVWSHHRCPDTYVSYVAYANALHKQHFYHAYDVVVEELLKVYQEIPSCDMNLSCPSLIEVPEHRSPRMSRANHDLQKKEWKVWNIRTPRVNQEIGGWQMLLRFFAERSTVSPLSTRGDTEGVASDVARRLCNLPGCEETSYDVLEAFSVRQYTRRKTSCLVKRWCGDYLAPGALRDDEL